MKTIANLIHNNLQKKASELTRLEQIVTSALPTACQGHVNVAGVRDNQLILITNSPVWASKLRLYRQNIIQMLAEHGGIKVSSVLIRQSHDDAIQTRPRVAKFRHLDEPSARLINQTADSITDPALKQALYHLAKNTNKSD